MNYCKRCETELEEYEMFHCDVCEHYLSTQSSRVAEKMLQNSGIMNVIVGPYYEAGVTRFNDDKTPDQQFNEFQWRE